MTRSLFIKVIGFTALLALTGCTVSTQQTASPTATVTTPANQADLDPRSTSYPPPGAEVQEIPDLEASYPAPEPLSLEPNPTLPADLSPSAGHATVKGRLVTLDGSIYVTNLYLANFLSSDDPSAPKIATFSDTGSPLAIQDPATGEFAFMDIEPGRYGLAISSPAVSLILPAADGSYLSFEVQAGEIFDLGDVIIP